MAGSNNVQPHKWKAGQSGNPKGRPKGSKNLLSQAFIEALHTDFAEHGERAIQSARRLDPLGYLKVVASLVPKDLNLNVNPIEEMTDVDLKRRIRELSERLGPIIDLTADEVDKVVELVETDDVDDMLV